MKTKPIIYLSNKTDILKSMYNFENMYILFDL